MQELWRSGVRWDEPLDLDHVGTWQTIAEHLHDATDILLPRCYLTYVRDMPKNHMFSVMSAKKHMEPCFTFATPRAKTRHLNRILICYKIV